MVCALRRVSHNHERALLAKHVERQLGGKNPDAGAVAEDLAVAHLAADAARQSDIDGSDGDVCARLRAGLAGDGESEGGADATPRADRHSLGCLLANGAVPIERLFTDSQ